MRQSNHLGTAACFLTLRGVDAAFEHRLFRFEPSSAGGC